jgi:hypothetical protein
MVNIMYHKNICKTLISKKLLLGDKLYEHPGFAIDVLRNFGKDMTNT